MDTPTYTPAPRPPASTPKSRDKMLEEHLGLVHHVARQLARGLAADTDFDELVSAGTMGLINAVDSFDASRGLAFSTFAAPRIRGAILDELRRQDHVPRSLRRKSRDVAAAREELSRTLGRTPDDREIAEHMGIEVATLWRWQAELEGTVHLSLSQPTQTDRQATQLGDQLPGDGSEVIEDHVNLQQEIGHLREAILGLKEQERVVLSLYYFEDLKLIQIAEVLGLTESRVSQIRSKALGKLREHMTPLRENVA
jgi:RNA polymerase sigma factor FliA